MIEATGERTGVCPNCGRVYIKDDHCEHVNCPDCKTDFNFCCSSFRSPCLTHGIHYHRPDCKIVFIPNE
jgi:hypothetical protein